MGDRGVGFHLPANCREKARFTGFGHYMLQIVHQRPACVADMPCRAPGPFLKCCLLPGRDPAQEAGTPREHKLGALELRCGIYYAQTICSWHHQRGTDTSNKRELGECQIILPLWERQRRHTAWLLPQPYWLGRQPRPCGHVGQGASAWAPAHLPP